MPPASATLTPPPAHTTIQSIAARLQVAIDNGSPRIGRADAVALIDKAEDYGLPVSPALQKLRADKAIHYPAHLVAALIQTMATTTIVPATALGPRRMGAPLPAAIELAGDEPDPDEAGAPLLELPATARPAAPAATQKTATAGGAPGSSKQPVAAAKGKASVKPKPKTPNAPKAPAAEAPAPEATPLPGDLPEADADIDEDPAPQADAKLPPDERPLTLRPKPSARRGGGGGGGGGPPLDDDKDD